MTIHVHKLVKKAQKGDADAFTQLFVQYEPELYRIAFLYVRHEQDALDVVQETAYRSFRGVGRIKQPEYFKTWLIRIAISCAIDLLRRRGKASPSPRNDAAETASFSINERDHEEAAATSLLLRQLLDDLDETEKGIILLRYYQDLTIRETAELLDIPLGSAKTMLYRALGKLRMLLREEDDYE